MDASVAMKLYLPRKTSQIHPAWPQCLESFHSLQIYGEEKYAY